MSTNINISVGDNKLLDQARLQQNASRQAQLEKEGNKRLKNQAEAQLTNVFAAQGKDAQGDVVAGLPKQSKFKIDEPAANSSETTKLGHGWTQQVVTDTTTVGIGLRLIDANDGTGTCYGVTNFATGTGQYQYNVYAGKGSNSAALPTYNVNDLPAPTEGYTWQPSYGYYRDPNLNWYAYAVGFRTCRYSYEQNEINIGYFALPAGGGSFVLFVFYNRVKWSANVATPCFAVKGPYPGGTEPPSNLFPLEDKFTLERIPGCQLFTGIPLNTAGVPQSPLTNPSADIYNVTEHGNLAFICNNSSIREINISAKLAEFMNWINPPIETAGTIDLTMDLGFGLTPIQFNVPRSSFNSSNLSNISYPFYSTPTYSPSGLYGNGFYKITPQLFKSLNDYYSFTASSNIIDYANIENRVSADTRIGAYSQANSAIDLYASSLPLSYAKNKKVASISELGKTVFSLVLNSARPPVESTINGLYVAWDWDKPAYCKARLADLGISAADLTP